MAWDTPSVNRARQPRAATAAGAPARPVAFGEILRRLVLALVVGLACGWLASWIVPVAGLQAQRLIQLAAGGAGFALAAWLQWRPRRRGLPQRVLEGADRRWIGGRQYDSELRDVVVGESLVEVVVDVVTDIATD